MAALGDAALINRDPIALGIRSRCPRITSRDSGREIRQVCAASGQMIVFTQYESQIHFQRRTYIHRHVGTASSCTGLGRSSPPLSRRTIWFRILGRGKGQ